ncbi:MAG TPA: xanthine dehydrogenase family protein subunit M [Gemmatimonadaceae bacterium]|nr:xanthine dehydrogenase family protein subunit M [Gemmatimonadaceae bacterium]
MHPFTYYRPSSLDDALSRLAGRNAAPLGGGTDLLVLLKEGLGAPDELVDLRVLPGYHDIVLSADGGARIGAGARVSDLAARAEIRRRFPALAEACDAVGTTALRHMGTLGGNLCQRPRCWYFRRGISCLKSGGDRCWAAEGENQYHAILEGGPCYIVHPSDPAVALTALDAAIEVRGAAGMRRVPIGEFYVLPMNRIEHETVLQAGEVVTAVEIPAASAGGWQRYWKLMQRGSWDFALVSLAAVRRRDGGVRLVMGGVAPRPWRVPLSVEEDVAGGGLDPHDVATLADRALYDARPLAKNGYKVDMAAALLRRSITELGRAAPV